MNNSAFVSRLEGFADLVRDGQRLRDRDRTASNPIRQRLAFDQFENQKS